MAFYKRLLIGSSFVILLIIIGSGWWLNQPEQQDQLEQQEQLNNVELENLLDKKEKIKEGVNSSSASSSTPFFVKVTEDKKAMEDKKVREDQEEDVEESVEGVISDKILKVPFMVQAPYGNWNNSIYQDGCEEASVIMAMAWLQDEELTPAIADERIVAMANWQNQHYGCAVDTSADDTVKRLFNEYFGYKKVMVKNVNSANDLIDELINGNLIIVPTNGQLLNNPYYTAPGPERHNLVVYAYDELTNEFVTNDPGTKRGAGYRYSANVLFKALRNYPSGCHVENIENEKVMIIVNK